MAFRTDGISRSRFASAPTAARRRRRRTPSTCATSCCSSCSPARASVCSCREFGGGVRRLVFEPASDVLRGVVKARITQALSSWLGHRLTVEMIDVRVRRRPPAPGERAELLLDRQTGGFEVTVSYRPAGSARLARRQVSEDGQ